MNLSKRLCSYYTGWFFVPTRKAIRCVTDHFRDQRGAASLHYRGCAVITILVCEQKPGMIFVPAQRLSGIV